MIISLKNNNLSAGTIVKHSNKTVIVKFLDLEVEIQKKILFELQDHQFSIEGLHLIFFRQGISLTKIARHIQKDSSPTQEEYLPLNFEKIRKKAQLIARQIKINDSQIISALLGYTTKAVIKDEIKRSLELLENLDQNSQYFSHQVGHVASYLPLNQLLYSLICFGVVPSFMSKCIHIRAPQISHDYFQKLLTVLELEQLLPNISVSFRNRYKFTSSLVGNVEAVIFVGSPKNAEQIKRAFGDEVLFMQNGSGHNPIIVASDADLEKASDSILKVCLYNQGQDCAAPNSILVHDSVSEELLSILQNKLIQIEPYVGLSKNPHTIIGENNDPEHLVQICKLLHKHKNDIFYGGTINLAKNLIYPTIIKNSLILGGNYQELFAPIILLQTFNTLLELESYFSHKDYKKNAMFLTVFEKKSFINESITIKDLHPSDTLLLNTDLHSYEKGYLPYGGYGENASCIFYKNKKIPQPILPHRDLNLFLVKKSLN